MDYISVYCIVYSCWPIVSYLVDISNARSQSLVMDGFPSIVQRMATSNRPFSDTAVSSVDGQVSVCVCVCVRVCVCARVCVYTCTC